MCSFCKMRVPFSESCILPFYSSKEERHYHNFDNNVPVIVFPDFASIKLQLTFGETDFNYQGASLWSVAGNHVPTTVTQEKKSGDVDNDGNTEYFWRLNGVSYSVEPTETKFYLEILVDGVSYYSDDFFICSAMYKIEFWEDCNRENFGYFDSGAGNDWKNILYLNDMYIRESDPDKLIEERANGYGGTTKVYQRHDIEYTAEIKGANFLRHATNVIGQYDNIRLTNISTSQEWTIYDLASANAGSNGAFALGITYKTAPSEKLNCGIDSYENAPYTDPSQINPGDLTCGSFGVTITQVGMDLQYTLQNDPDGAVVETVTWTRNGRWIGDGASVALGAYGNYGVRIQKKNCTVYDYYNYQDVCLAMSTDFSVNNGTINATTSNPPSTVSYEVFNPSGTSVATSLPYVAVVDGVHTLKVTSDTCEKIVDIPVQITGAVDCSFTFDVEKDASNLLSIANNTATSYTVEWFKVTSGNSETSVGTGDTYQITAQGTYIARMTADSCTKDVIYVYLENESPVNSKYGGYQRFLNFTGQTIAITKFTLPSPVLNSESEIDERLVVKVDGVTQLYKTTPTAINEYNFDFADNEIILFFSVTNADIQIYRTYIEN